MSSTQNWKGAMAGAAMLMSGGAVAAELKPAAKGTLELTAWLVYWDQGMSLKSFEAHAGLIDRVCPQYYECGKDGMPAYLPEATTEIRAKTRAIAKSAGVKLLPLMNNFLKGDFEPKRVSKFLNDPALMHAHVARLIAMAKDDGADGLDVDYEGLFAKDRDAFSRFIEALAAEAHGAGLKVAIAVHPKDSEPGNWEGAQAQDWKRLGAAVDLFRIMAYDMHWATSEPGPVAGPAWAEKVLNFGLSLVDAAKVELGIPQYGYDWKGGGKVGTTSHGWADFQELLKAKGPARRDEASSELVLKYEGREVWYVDAIALKPKFASALKHHIRGLALWRLGSEDPAFWGMIKESK